MQKSNKPILSKGQFPSSGEIYEFDFGGDFVFHLRHNSEESMTYTSQKGTLKGVSEIVKTSVTSLLDGIFMVSWQEKDKKTVVHIRDFEKRNRLYKHY